MKKIFLRRIFSATLFLGITLTLNFSAFTNNVQAKSKYAPSEKIFIKSIKNNENNLKSNLSNNGFVEVHPIPEDFDATKATDEELEYYNLPARPKDNNSKKMAEWKKVVSFKWIKPEIVETKNNHSLDKEKKSITGNKKYTTNSSSIETTMNSDYNTSRGWSGYVYNKPAVSVRADWIVPEISAPSNYRPAQTSQWIGLGGNNSITLVQSGTTGEVDDNGNIKYLPFYELIGTNYFTDAELTIDNMSCTSGDAIGCKVSVFISGNNMTAKFAMVNFSKKIQTSFTVPVSQFDSRPQSAEWISEAPSKYLTINGQTEKTYYNYGKTTDPISNETAARFATCAFNTSDPVSDNNDIGISEASNLMQINMLNGSKILAQPTKPGSGTFEGCSLESLIFDIGTSESFNVNWKNYV